MKGADELQMTKVQKIYQQELEQALKDHEKMLRAKLKELEKEQLLREFESEKQQALREHYEKLSGEIKEYTLNIAQKLINAKDLSLTPEKVAEVTGLTVEEIIRLKK